MFAGHANHSLRGTTAERSFVQANEFALVFHDHDWRLNDLTGGAPR